MSKFIVKIAAKELSEDLMTKFSELRRSLDPEALSADGERAMEEQRRLYTQLMRKWRNLEQEAGRKVTEKEVWDWGLERMRKSSKKKSAYQVDVEFVESALEGVLGEKPSNEDVSSFLDKLESYLSENIDNLVVQLF